MAENFQCTIDYRIDCNVDQALAVLADLIKQLEAIEAKPDTE